MGTIERCLGEQRLGRELEDQVRRHLDDRFAAIQEQLQNKMKPGVSYDMFGSRCPLTIVKDHDVD